MEPAAKRQQFLEHRGEMILVQLDWLDSMDLRELTRTHQRYLEEKEEPLAEVVARVIAWGGGMGRRAGRRDGAACRAACRAAWQMDQRQSEPGRVRGQAGRDEMWTSAGQRQAWPWAARTTPA